MIEKLVSVSCDGGHYLCEVAETKDKVTLCNASEFERGFESTVVEWITAQNLGELETITLGKGAGYTVKPLDANKKRLLKRLWEDMQEVKRTALPRLENAYFKGNEEDDE